TDTLANLLADTTGPDITSYEHHDELVATLADLKAAFEPHQYDLVAITRQIFGLPGDAPVGRAEIIAALHWSGQAHTHNQAHTVADIAAYVRVQTDPVTLAQSHIDHNVPELSGWATDPGSVSAYSRLADWGNIWAGPRQAGYPGGRAFIAQMSANNFRYLQDQVGPREAWHQGVLDRLEQALKGRVLHHYTTADRIETMLVPGGGGVLKSKAQLMSESAGTAANNTPPFDQVEFANDAFVFFFLADPNAPFRDSRFGSGGSGPVRVALPQHSLTDSGWIMLTDFHDREWPTLRTDAEGNLLSYRRDTANQANSPEARLADAQWKIAGIWAHGNEALDIKAKILSGDISQILRNDPDSFDSAALEKIIMFTELNKEIREKLRAAGTWDALQQHSADREKHLNNSLRFDQQVRRYWPQMLYSAVSNWAYPMGGGKTRHIDGSARSGKEPARLAGQFSDTTDFLDNNVLAGAHIVPGLALRALLEIQRIEQRGGNQALVDRLKNMTGDQLVDTLMKD
ncbi:hypothetical protein, partial [Streptomyces lonarensis]